MFRISSLKLISSNQSDIFFETDKKHILYYAGNSKGKTVFLKVLNYMLGSSESIKLVDGTKNINSIEICIIINDITLYVKRSIEKERDIKYSIDGNNFIQIELEDYKKLISNYMNKNNITDMIMKYQAIVGFLPNIRSFIFLNYIDENNIGDPKRIFPNAFDYRYFSRIRNTIIYLFNDNRIDIAEKQQELQQLNKHKQNVEIYKITYEQYKTRIKEMFSRLKLMCNDKDSIKILYQSYQKYKNDNDYKVYSEKNNLDQLLQKKYELENEYKNSQILEDLIKNGKQKYKNNILLLDFLNKITPNEQEYKKYHELVIDEIDKYQYNLFIFNSSKIMKQQEDIKNSIKKLDDEINKYYNNVRDVTYKQYLEYTGILDASFINILELNEKIKSDDTEQNIKQLEDELKYLKKDFNHSSIAFLNNKLNSFYKNNLMEIDFIKEDVKFSNLTFKFDPYKVSIVSSKNDTDFFSGSKARATILQVSFMLIIHEYIQHNFPDLPVLPLLMFDTIDQPFESNNFNIFYNELIKYADKIGVQTVVTTKTKIYDVPADVMIIEHEKFNKYFDE